MCMMERYKMGPYNDLQSMTEDDDPGGSGYLFEVTREELRTEQLAVWKLKSCIVSEPNIARKKMPIGS